MRDDDLERVLQDLEAHPQRSDHVTQTCASPPATLTVMVFCALDKTAIGAAVELKGAASSKGETDDATGVVTFDPTPPGSYQVLVTLSEAQLQRYRPPAERALHVSAGETKTALIPVERFTPYHRVKLVSSPIGAARATLTSAPPSGAKANHQSTPPPGGHGQVKGD